MMPAARTGRDTINRKAVTARAHGKRGTRSPRILFGRIFFTVTKKLMDATREEAPAMWSEKIAMSTPAPVWPTRPDSGG